MPTAAGAPPATPSITAPPQGLTSARWLFVDDKRTHEVFAGVRASAFVVKESAFGNAVADEILSYEVEMGDPWEGAMRLLELENRLALIGSYWKHDAQAPGWVKLKAPAFTSIDLRPISHHGRVHFHHYAKKGSPRVTLAVIPRPGPRYLLARAEYEYPLVEEGSLALVHAHLTPAPAISLLAREQLALFGRGYTKIVVPEPDMQDVHDVFLRRLSEGRLGGPKERAAAPVDDLYTDYSANLNDPRLIAIHARFLTAEEEAQALAGGPLAIKRLVQAKRLEFKQPNEGMLLSMVEASLLARDGLSASRPHVDPEVAALVRRFSYYL